MDKRTQTLQTQSNPFISGTKQLAAGYAVPPIELLIGILLLTGLFTRYALTLASLLMMILMFGTTLKQDWATASTQLLYGLVLALLLFARERYDPSWRSLLRLSKPPYG